MSDLSEKMRRLVEQDGRSQKDIAKELNISESALSRYLKGEREPHADVLVKMARYFNVNVEYFYGKEQAPENFSTLKRALARNAGQLTDAERIELISIISKGR